MRLTTWNVNGIRNPFGYQPWNSARTFPAMFDILESDIVVMQELKIQRKDLRDDMVLIDGWDCYFSLPKQKKGMTFISLDYRSEVILTAIRVFWSRHLHSQCHLRSYPRRRRRARCPLRPELNNSIP